MTRRYRSRFPGPEEYLDLWSRLHGTDARSRPVVRGWLLVVHRLARPLLRARVPADAVTLVGLALSLAALAPAAAGGRWALLVPVTVLAAGLADSLDGAVAAMSGTAGAWGAVLDAVVDRVAEAALAGTLWLLGAPAALVAAVVATGWLHEYLRARAQATGLTGPVVITVSERPTRLAVPAMFALGAGVLPGSATLLATVGAGAGAAAGLAGLVHLAVAARSRLCAGGPR